MLNRTTEVDLSNYVENGEWYLVSIKIQRNVVRTCYLCGLFHPVTFRSTKYITSMMSEIIFPFCRCTMPVVRSPSRM